MTNIALIQHLTWALIELDLSRPDVARVREVLQMALNEALLAQEREITLKASLARTAKVMGA